MTAGPAVTPKSGEQSTIEMAEVMPSTILMDPTRLSYPKPFVYVGSCQHVSSKVQYFYWESAVTFSSDMWAAEIALSVHTR